MTLSTAFAQAPIDGGESYRTFFGLNSRLVVWIVAELHLMFGAFVLGVPIFAVIVEFIGMKTKDSRYDRLAYEFTKLLSAAFATTAALGGLLAFTLFGLYPHFMNYMTGVFHESMYIYALLFFAEGFTLYLYYYSWERLQNKKWLHLTLGIFLNLWGTILLVIANSWATFMMTPTGIEEDTGRFIGTAWEAIRNPLWMPLNIHRLLGNVAFGGFIAGAYAAVKFLGAKTDEERAHYDWMGYVGNFVGLAALIPLPFAGYYMGREIYSASPVMGNNMMGGAFSWTFIIQAILVGAIFIGGNYYLWTGMGRIPGAERYVKYIKYINVILFLCFAVWLTPHNLPLTSEEQIIMGGQYHPVLKYLGLMAAKNAVIQFIILSTFFSLLLYRRGNKGKLFPFSEQGNTAKIILMGVGAVCLLLLGNYARILLTLDPSVMDLAPEKAQYFKLPAMLLLAQMGTFLLAILLTFQNKGILAQLVCFGMTVSSAVFFLGVYGFVVMTNANPFLRQIAVVQVLLVGSCLIMVTAIDTFLFRKAELVGGMIWGKMTARSQYTLVFLCVAIVLLMGLMGFIRSGLRENWHIYGVLQDTSPDFWTPTNAYMGRVVGAIVLIFLGSVSFVFWLAGLGEKEEVKTPQLGGTGILPVTTGNPGHTNPEPKRDKEKL
ncbi:cytochrome ubiquinol oxidase subunit I [candidate division TA06 bacterium]|nr:cytochrome ubiquinol oxidase subunit I [candidate division TA06 bacterium]